MTTYEHFQIETLSGVTILKLVDPSLTSNAVIFELDEELERFVREARPQMLLIQFSGVKRTSTAVINSLLRTLRRLDALGCRLKLCELAPNLRAEFEMLQLDGSVFDIHETQAGALEQFLTNEDDKYRRFKVQRRDDVHVLHLLDSRLFNNLMVSELDDELDAFLSERQPAKLLVNFGPVARCSTAVINSLLRVRSRMLETGGRIRLCGMNEHIRGEFNMLSLEGTVFDIDDSASEAFARFN